MWLAARHLLGCALLGVALAALLVPVGASANPALGPVTSVLAFAGYRDGASAIYKIGTDGSGERRLTAASDAAFVAQPAYSPDGTRIAYVCGNFELCVMNADGSGQGRLTTNRWPAAWVYVDHPSWSPDGKRIAFASNAGGTFHVYVIGADGSALRQLAGTGMNDDDPAWSPDGSKIAFDAYRSWSSSTSNVYVMNADGTQPQRLTSRSDEASNPEWSPDGTKIVGETYDDVSENTHLFEMNADGSDKILLTGGDCNEFDPVWSPYGPTLAFERSCAGKLGIAVGDFSRLDRLTGPSNGFDRFPSWQPPVRSGASATPIGLPSSPAADARLVGAYYIGDAELSLDDTLNTASVAVERKYLRDDAEAIAALTAIQPQTARGKLLRKDALLAFRLDAKSSRAFISAAYWRGRRDYRAAKGYERAANRLADRENQAFDAADSVARLPYG
jgi:dipeptidyl aminopeptidase/acylaminoacyl peptidase